MGLRASIWGRCWGPGGVASPPGSQACLKKKNGNQRGKRYTIADIEGFHTRQKSGGTFPGGGGPIPTD